MRALRSGTALGCVLLLALLVAPGRASASSPAGTSAGAAVRVAHAHDLSVGIALVDTSTGTLVSAGESKRRYPTASVAKTLIATALLLRHRCRGHNAALAWRMITESDNAAAYALYDKVGGDALLPALAKHYRIHDLGRRPTEPGHWGSTQVTARGLAQFYAAIRRDKTVWPWLGKAMRHWHKRSSAGEPNDFGIAAAAPRSAVKNGWVTGRDPRHRRAATFNTTGFVDDGRYAVVILGEGPGRLYLRPGERALSQVARTLLPHGHVPAVR
jgi:hypothetical protein